MPLPTWPTARFQEGTDILDDAAVQVQHVTEQRHRRFGECSGAEVFGQGAACFVELLESEIGGHALERVRCTERLFGILLSEGLFEVVETRILQEQPEVLGDGFQGLCDWLYG